MSNTTLVVRVTPEVHKRFRMHALKNDETVQEALTRLVEAELKGKRT